MIISRKTFLRATGFSLLVAAGKKLGVVFADAAQNAAFAPSRALTAGRWAMLVDISKCLEKEDCTKCIQACDRSHNVPEFTEPAHQVKWIWKASFENVFPSQQHDYVMDRLKEKPVLALCNHCSEPPCVRVCPTQATWKRADGIVMMDWHRCIGCRYCMAACPYGSRSFNWLDPRPHIAKLNPDFPTRTKGVVEKCNFCEERLAKGQLPACVEACPQKAMVFGDLDDPNSQVRELLRSRYTIQRKPELGTKPEIFYIV
jgi:molybdopterin-containing oxidoreductase family iron-sulfur binding subunit